MQRRRARLRAAKGNVSTAESARILSARKCHICGRPFTKANPPTLDHIIALADGGAHEVSNLAAAHQSCNAMKNVRRENPLTSQGLLL